MRMMASIEDNVKSSDNEIKNSNLLLPTVKKILTEKRKQLF